MLAMLGLASPIAEAQQWNDARALELATRATERRAQQIADPQLADYTADATGVLTFQVKFGERVPVPPLTVLATQLALKVYWMQPGRSKQVIVGMRDTLLLPGNIGYYTDRYGIVQNNFPDVIRLGDGRDVRDVPHPLSQQGLREYDFAIQDSLSIILSEQRIDVYEVAVRPKNDRLPRVIGKLYIALQSAAVVKMSFTFTRSAYLDKRNEALTVTLENALVEGRFWLPRRQELDLIRAEQWLDFPGRTMIRARWEVCCYSVNLALTPANFVGPEIVRSSPAVLAAHKWEEQDILKVLPPDVRILTPQEVRSIRSDAEKFVRDQALSQVKGGSLSARRISDFLRINRVEGVAPGLGAKLRSGTGASVTLNGRYGIWDHEAKGRVALSLERSGGQLFRLFAERDYQDVATIQERSLAFNSIAAPLFGSDYTDQFDSRTLGASVDLAPIGTVNSRIEISYQTHSPLDVHLNPLTGTFPSVVPATRTKSMALGLSLYGTIAEGSPLASMSWNLASELAAFSDRDSTLRLNGKRYLRLNGDFSMHAPVGSGSLLITGFAGSLFAKADAPPQKLFYLGGPISAPGYNFHELSGTTAATIRAELRLPLPFFSISLGKYGRSPANFTIAPYVASAYISDPPSFSERSTGFYPSAGLGAAFLFDLLRLDVARGLRDGRFIFSIDIMREFWGIL